MQLLIKIAEQEDKQELADFLREAQGRVRVRAVHHLAGGNPRVYVIFAQFLTRSSLDELIGPVMQTLDDLTPYYQSRMGQLSPQQRKIVQFLCNQRRAVAVAEIAGSNFLTHQGTSSQLKKLKDLGYVRSETVGRESYYELNEPLMRIALEIKKNRGEPIRLVVEFLRCWYTRVELEKRLEIRRPITPFEESLLSG